MRARGDVTTVAALDECRVPAAIQEENTLFLSLEARD
jgi:hypothetical protein